MQTSVCLSLRYIPLHPTGPTSSHHGTHLHPITRHPSSQTEGGDALKATTLLHLDLIIYIFFKNAPAFRERQPLSKTPQEILKMGEHIQRRAVRECLR